MPHTGIPLAVRLDGGSKETPGVHTDLNDGVVRRVGLHAGIWDNKVCAISEAYSRLRLVVRVADCGGLPAAPAATSAATTAAAAAEAAALLAWACLVDGESPPVVFFAVHFLDGLCGLGVIGHLDEAEAA